MERIEGAARGSLEDLVAAAVSAGATIPLAEDARRITAARFRLRGSAPVSDRAGAYFWGVVRRRALRGAAPVLARSLVAASLAEDLAAAGHPDDAIRREVVRLCGEHWAALAGAPVQAA